MNWSDGSNDSAILGIDRTIFEPVFGDPEIVNYRIAEDGKIMAADGTNGTAKEPFSEIWETQSWSGAQMHCWRAD